MVLEGTRAEPETRLPESTLPALLDNARSRTRRIAFAVSTRTTVVSFLLVLPPCVVGLAGNDMEADGDRIFDTEPADLKSHRLLTRPTALLASRRACSASILGSSTSFQGFLALWAEEAITGGVFSSSSPPSSILPLRGDVPAPEPGRSSTSPARAKCSWRSLMEPSS